MNLILVRHGEAHDSDPQQSWGMDDCARPLSPKGEKQAESAAKALSKIFGKVDQAVSSKLKRAIDTASFFSRHFAIEAPLSFAEFAPEGDPEKQVAKLTDFDPDSTLVVVGHQPSISALASFLLCGRPILGVEFQTSTICVISFSAAPKAGKGVLKALISPQISAAIQAK